MDNHTDAFYEIEFQRLYRQQGRVLRRITHLENQLQCYINKYNELVARGISSLKLKERINITIDRLAKEYAKRDGIEADKESVSLNKPENRARAIDAGIISDAYERAYAPVETAHTPYGVFGRFCKYISGRNK